MDRSRTQYSKIHRKKLLSLNQWTDFEAHEFDSEVRHSCGDSLWGLMWGLIRGLLYLLAKYAQPIQAIQRWELLNSLDSLFLDVPLKDRHHWIDLKRVCAHRQYHHFISHITNSLFLNYSFPVLYFTLTPSLVLLLVF